jgi:RNA polymerase sigma-70 factor, ECF subfamily
MGKLLQLSRRVDTRVEAPRESLENRTDEELAALVRVDSRAAFRVLVVRYAERVVAFCAKISGDRAASREVAQSVWLAVWDARIRWEPHAAFASYLFTIAYSRAQNHARSLRRGARVFAPEAAHHEHHLSEDPQAIDLPSL